MKLEIEGEIGNIHFKVYAEDEDAKALTDFLLRTSLQKQAVKEALKSE